MFHVNLYLVPLYLLTAHLRVGSSANWQQAVAKEGWQMLGAAQSQQCQAGHPSSLEGGKDRAQLGSTSTVPGSTTHNIHRQKIHYWPNASGRTQSNSPLLWVLLRLGC